MGEDKLKSNVHYIPAGGAESLAKRLSVALAGFQAIIESTNDELTLEIVKATLEEMLK